MHSCCGSQFLSALIALPAAAELAAALGAPGAVRPMAGGAEEAPAATDRYADTIFQGGPVIPIEGPLPETEAVAVKDGRIVALGDRASVLQWRGPATTLVDLAGRALLPGFVEPHVHTVSAAGPTAWLDVGPFTTPTFDAMIQKLRAAVQTARPGEWVQAVGFDPSLMPGPPTVTTADLDPFSPNNPVFLVHSSGHFAYANTRALEAAHVTNSTPNPAGGGRYVKDASGLLTGAMEESPSYAPFIAAMPQITPEQLTALTTGLLRLFAANGCTTVNDAGVGILSRDETTLLEALAQVPETPVRISGFLTGLRLDEWVAAGLAPGQGTDRLRYTAIKFWTDGSTQGLTAALREPYLGTTNRGALNYAREDLEAQVQRAHDLGWQVAIHANGDAALDQALDVYEAVLARSPRADHRHRIEHCTVNDDAQIERLARLGVTPSFLIGHVHYWGRVFRDRILGPDRAAHLDPTGTALRLGIPFSLHCDFSVTPPEPLRYMQTAVTRRMRDGGEVLGPEQRIPVDAALEAVTIYPAHQLRMDHLVGSLAVGKLADFVILDQNPRTVDPDSLASLQVTETWLGGVQQHGATAPAAG
jgi:predicted amidohydrolase YtcJ